MIICLIGEPATGKTTLMRAIMADIGTMELILKPFCHHKLGKTVVLGKYETGVFQGTDKLSMGVQPLAVDFIRNNPEKLILFEGDRLGNLSFFKECKKYHDLHIFCLLAETNVKEIRHIVRADKQTEPFKKAKKTKVENILNAERCNVFNNNCYKDSSLIKEAIFKTIYQKK